MRGERDGLDKDCVKAAGCTRDGVAQSALVNADGQAAFFGEAEDAVAQNHVPADAGNRKGKVSAMRAAWRVLAGGQ
jgi:hypothetical protein